MKTGIYCIENRINHKKYIGQSVNISQRWTNHKWYVKTVKVTKGNIRNTISIIHLAMKKYGIENFQFSIIEECQISQLDEREKYWIRELNTQAPFGYNVLKGGQLNKRPSDIPEIPLNFCADCHAPIGKNAVRCSDCEKKRRKEVVIISEQQLNEIEKMLFERKSMIFVAHYFGFNSNTFSKRLRKNGMPCTRKMLIKDYCEKHNIILTPTVKVSQRKKVQKISLTGKVIAEYNSIAEAARQNGIHANLIRKVLHGKLTQTHGAIWKFIPEQFNGRT